MKKPRVHLTGWQKVRWALDEDLEWARRALEGAVEWTDLPRAGIVHAAWWPAVIRWPAAALRGKHVVCFADNPPAFYLTQPGFEKAAARVDLWIARTSQAANQFAELGLKAERVPYCVDTETFRPLGRAAEIRSEFGIPDDAFVIGNFHRDSEGADLTRPKLQKGPDLLLEIAVRLREVQPRLCVLLAGPRRHWLLKELEKAKIPVVYAGNRPGHEDDFAANILSRGELNRLYQSLDCCVISSRWEGGPYSVLEALASGVPVISTPVGTSCDVLPCGHLFESPLAAVEILKNGRPEVLPYPGTHTADVVRDGLRSVYKGFAAASPRWSESLRCAVEMVRSIRTQADWSREPSNRRVEQAMQSVAADDRPAPSVVPARPTALECAAGIRAAIRDGGAPKIVGIVLVRNEDRFLEHVLANAANFCDHWILLDNGSSDGTFEILERFAKSHASVEIHRLKEASESHGFLRRYEGTRTWVFGLDGDELYDPRGLVRLRKAIRRGDFSREWMLLGHVLHVTKWDAAGRAATGHTTPPCRSMTKLYNFAAIKRWSGYCPERLHGGKPEFRSGFSNSRRRFLHDEGPWDSADFRCLHLCFERRSSIDETPTRANLMEIQGSTRSSRLTGRLRMLFGAAPAARWKDERYRRGEAVTISTADFFQGDGQ